MATTQQYSLRWNNYFRHLTYALDNHRVNDDFVDVSLCCDGRKIKAHKVVLSACSTYFREIFKENPHPHPVIIFKFIKFEDLNSIIEFMYQGEVNVQQEALQSFLQTAELLAVQGLTAEEKEKTKVAQNPVIDEQKLIKTIPSTIRAVNETATATATATQTATQTMDSSHMTLGLNNNIVTPTATQTSTQTIDSTQQINLNLQPQAPQQHHHVQTQIHNMVALPTSTNTVKKRKITFTNDDDNIYTTETVDYGVKDEQTIVKILPPAAAEMTFLRGTVKMDIPEYIVSDVDDSQQLSDGTSHQAAQDAANAAAAQNVTQYTSEYEILTESEIEEKYQQAEAENAEITIEMGRLLNPTSGTTTTTTQGNTLDDANTVTNTGGTVKTDNKGSGTGDMPNNKWTECQFCKMVITTVNLWRHIRTQHTPQPPRKCDLCNKNFKNKYSLREHIRISHEQKITVKSEN